MYSPDRKGQRVACADKCLLVCDSVFYSCSLENLSVSGVLLNINDIPRADIKNGDTCILVMGSDPMRCPGEYRSKVSRFYDSQIALQFLDIKF